MQGSVQRSVQGLVQGSVQGSLQGSVQRSVQGSMQGSVQGSVCPRRASAVSFFQYRSAELGRGRELPRSLWLSVIMVTLTLSGAWSSTGTSEQTVLAFFLEHTLEDNMPHNILGLIPPFLASRPSQMLT